MALAETLDPQFLQRLVDSVQWSRRQLATFHAKRMEILRQYVGRHYGGDNAARQPVPQPFIRLHLSILARHLVASNPQIMAEAKNPATRPIAFGLQEWANQAFVAMDMQHVLKRWVMDAIVFPVGLLKICSAVSSVYDGQPDMVAWPDVVDPERSVYDMMATSWRQLDYIGHRYTCPKEQLKGEGFDEVFAASLPPETYSATTDAGAERTETLQQTGEMQARRLRDYVDIWELYLPKEQLLVSFPVIGNGIDPRPVRVEKYFGPRNPTNTGPFYLLGFDEVPGALMPTPPLHAIYDLHMDINGGVRKLMKQMKRQKNITTVGQAALSDAPALRNANDGDMVPVVAVDQVKEIRMGGPDQQNLAYLLHLKQVISYFGGNFDVLGGLGANAPTKGQEELLAASSSKLVDHYQDEVVSQTTRVCEGLLWYEYHSRRPMPFTVQPEGMPQFSVEDQLTPEDRYGGGVSRWGQLGITVHPYSMRPASPQQRVQQWTSLFTQLILPVAPMLREQGVTIDFISFLRKIASYLGLPDLDEVLQILPLDPQAMMNGGAGAESSKPQRPGVGQYTRTNVSSQENQDQEVLSMMDRGDAEAG